MRQFSSAVVVVVASTLFSVAPVGAETAESANPDEITELALTGPSTASIALVVALLMVMLGLASLAIGRRVA